VARGQRDAIKVSRDEAGIDRFNYVAAGHYHVYTRLAENAYYCGATDYSSSDPWKELREEAKAGQVGKGFILQDIAAGTHEFHSLPISRPYLDLAPIDATGLGAADVDAAIRAAVESVSIDGAVVRLRVDHITQEVGRALNQKALREYKARALNFHLDERRAERVRPESIALVRQMGQTIAQRVEHELETRELTNDVDRAQLVDLAQRYLAEATEKLGDAKTGSNEPMPLIPDAAPQRRIA
jgi:DNA repair exonuclease SbcCD nuclease subunit